jgi:hypothetical protein
MSKRFLTPVNLPSGSSLPLVGSIGVLLYNSALSKWVNLSLADILSELGAITGEGGSYNTEQFAATIDGGSPDTTLFVSVFDGGNESSF